MGMAVDIFGIILLIAGLIALFWAVRMIVGILVGLMVCVIVLCVVMAFWAPGPLEPARELLLLPVNFFWYVVDNLSEAARVVTG